MKVKELLWYVVLGAGALYAYDKPKGQPEPQAAGITQPARRSAPEPYAPSQPAEDRSWIKPREEQRAVAASSSYQCDGRTHCSQMRSCDEANFFIRNCPNTQMDGDGDGIACERQWCE
ncbi:MAG: excalibur calcium-binding domain-containing protein [Thermomonas sp.]|uniref:excalibur calcium-binding domain-containing protein n=1 Tax=Thermomonas sp. TaxID=1971895 RepID=UPI0039E4F7CE